jgi:hypothetical protein
MATDILTATTPKEFAELFPSTVRPFAVWYNDDPGCDSRKWAVNGESGAACEEFEDMAMALMTAATLGKDWADEARDQAHVLANVTGETAEKTTGLPPDRRAHRLNTMPLFVKQRVAPGCTLCLHVIDFLAA